MANALFFATIRATVIAPPSRAPAKINLFLAFTGRRPDGFHDLVSVVAPLAWGDTLGVEPGGGDFVLRCDPAWAPPGADNLVLKAARAFRAATGWAGGARFDLEKAVPPGSGLGGASSDAAAALAALNRLAGQPLGPAELSRVAASVGSDCPLFLHGRPCVMRGRGERIEPLAPEAAARLSGRRVLVFRPGFAVSTPWAYGRLAAAAPRLYVPAEEAEARLGGWLAGGAPAEGLLFNSMERAAFPKFPALPCLLEALREAFGLACVMSGSGSACFALLPEAADAAPVALAVRRAWGPSALVVETRIS